MTKRFQFLEIPYQDQHHAEKPSEEFTSADDFLNEALAHYYQGRYTHAIKIIGKINLAHEDNVFAVSLFNILVLLCINNWKNARKLYYNLCTQENGFNIYHEIVGLFLKIPNHSSDYLLKRLSILQKEYPHSLIHWCRFNVLIYHKKISFKKFRRTMAKMEWSEDVFPFFLLSIEFFTHQKRYHFALLFIHHLLENQEENPYLYYLRAWNYYQLGLIQSSLKSLEITLSLDKGFLRARDLQSRINNRNIPEIILHFIKKIILIYS